MIKEAEAVCSLIIISSVNVQLLYGIIHVMPQLIISNSWAASFIVIGWNVHAQPFQRAQTGPGNDFISCNENKNKMEQILLQSVV